jgi:hypothetical protein
MRLFAFSSLSVEIRPVKADIGADNPARHEDFRVRNACNRQQAAPVGAVGLEITTKMNPC